jgi:hypothetical protein
MDKRTVNIIAIVGTTLLCGLPGLSLLCLGLLGVFGVYIPDSTVEFADNVERTGTLFVLFSVACLGVAGILTPILVAVFMLRQPKVKLPPVDINAPLPPPS